MIRLLHCQLGKVITLVLGCNFLRKYLSLIRYRIWLYTLRSCINSQPSYPHTDTLQQLYFHATIRLQVPPSCCLSCQTGAAGIIKIQVGTAPVLDGYWQLLKKS